MFEIARELGVPETYIPMPVATWLAALMASRCNLSVVMNVVEMVCDTVITLYIPDTGDSVLPDIMISDTG